MNTKTIDTDQIKQSIDLREYAGTYTTLRRESAHELAGPCPKCGGNDRFHCTDEWFFCRTCHEKRGDIIEFVMWMNGTDFKGAVAAITHAPLPSPTTRRTPTPKRPEVQPEEWARKATITAGNAHARLMDDTDKEAEAGRAYLDNRGIEAHAWNIFNFGYTSSAALPGTGGKQREPAIVIPWYRAGKVVALRYRFLQWHEYIDIDGKERREKQTAKDGSSFAGVLYGGQALDTGIAGLSTLIVCEGEMNAASIWQVSRYTHLDVLSLGSEDAGITPAMVEYATRYSTVITWLDKEAKALRAMTAFPGAYGIKSPNGQDANDLLQAGTLGGFLAMHRFQAAKDASQQEQLYYDLWDTIRLPGGIDTATQQVIGHIAKALGKQNSI